MSLKSRHLQLLVPVLTAGLLLSPAGLAAGPETERVNVVIILSDDQGYNSLSCAGATEFKTPNLDRLAAEGVRLTQCYASGPVCSPTRAALLTGNYQQRIGRQFDWVVGGLGASNGLPPSTPTLARMLKSNNYVTGIMGKWHLGGVPEQWPTRFGFDEFKGFVGGNLDYWRHEDHSHEPDLWDGDKPLKTEGYLTDLITQWSVDFIHRHRDRAFFLYVAYNAVHWPFQGPRDDQMNLDRSPKGEQKDWAVGGGTVDIYRGMMERLDWGIGRITQALDECRLAGRTLVIFFSDNGGDPPFASNRPLRGWKCELYEGGIRVPCILRWPGHIPAGRVCDQPIITMDLTATVLAATGTARAPQALPADGIDLIGILAGRVPIQPRRFCWLAHPPGPGAPIWRAVRDGDWKLLEVGEQQYLYNLREDPGEQHDLAGQHPQRLHELAKRHASWEATLPPKNATTTQKQRSR